MRLIVLLVFLLALVSVWCLVGKPDPFKKERYEDRQSECEGKCYSSPYYDACMNMCMEGSSAGWTGTPNLYESSPLEESAPLDEEGRGTLSTGPYRYDYPGH